SKRETLYGRISEQRIEEVGPWRRKYWKSIEQNYGRHPHFERYEKPLKAILFSSFERLVDLNGALIDFFRSELGITTPLLRASTLGVEGNKSELLHAICRKVEAETYLSGPSGRDYLDESLFHSSGIGVLYHGFEHPVYPQFRAKSFIPQLSTLDLLFNCGPESRDHFLPS
ncbi:MAG TPA: hypothetical protein DD435_03170, partial [Cyanobacteria bacterium UBA8530]|nr:hypothetical protein [Cyanobacteria bacterium UBA8530]